jgi:hypothetical protein
MPLTVPVPPTDVTVPPPPPETVAHDVLVPSVVRYLPEFDVCDGAKALKAEMADVAPVPPLAIGN